jgi:epoxyqueuosine reductase
MTSIDRPTPAMPSEPALPELNSTDVRPANSQATDLQPGEPQGNNLQATDLPLTDLRRWATEFGFSQIGIADVDLSSAEAGLLEWLAQGFHGSMDYMSAHGLKRARPAELVPGTLRVITARMDYLPASSADDWQGVEWQRLAEPARAQVSLYARGRDYHKVLRARLARLAERIGQQIGPLGYRVFTDSAPVLEVELAARSGIGWRGKHTLILHRDAGSMFFLGEIYVDLPLPLTHPVTPHCGSCSACIDVCPTQAILGPGRLDSRRCISYLTIEHDGPIPPALRTAIGNRIYGCDDCQLVCPWNKYAQRATLPDFDARDAVSEATLLEAWSWTQADFDRHTEGSAIRRIGLERWRRNLAVAMGNALRSGAGDAGGSLPARPGAFGTAERRAMIDALRRARDDASPLVLEHIDWALQTEG